MKHNKFFLYILSLSIFLTQPLKAESSVHGANQGVKCLECHESIPFEAKPLRFRPDLAKTCYHCHEEGHFLAGLKHPVFDITPTMKIPSDMPLDEEGQLTCITCHFYHTDLKLPITEDFLLRRPSGKLFCFYCHESLQFTK